ncbi:MAG: hypothetical protein RL299_1467, partial [Pseudomonadota bacterium]
MPFVLPTLPSRPLSPTHSYTVNWTGGITQSLSVGDTIYLSNIDHPGDPYWGPFFWNNGGSPAISLDSGSVPPYDRSTLNNAGIVWASSTLYSTTAISLGTVNNSGWIIAEAAPTLEAATHGYASGTSAYGVLGANGVTNSGTIYAYATGAALAVTLNGMANLDNSGTIAAVAVQNPHGQGSWAYGVLTWQPLVHITNQAGAQIVAQGGSATAIEMLQGAIELGGSGIVNHGLIEAVATGLNGRETAILVGVIFEWEHNEIVNDGTIRGSIAIEAADRAGYNLPIIGFDVPSTQIVHNLTGGLIDGDILLHLGDDWVTNAGTIIGTVDLGPGDDLFDGQGGHVDGVVFLGGGSDQFLGGSQNDVAVGGGGVTEMVGGNGADLLVGDGNYDFWGGSLGNDDYLEGGAGNDGLYGGGGKDWLITRDGDVAMAGDGDDVITTD